MRIEDDGQEYHFVKPGGGSLNATMPQFKHGYGTNAVRTDRDNEYHVFSRVTAMMREAVANGDRFAEIEAVAKNNHLWSILSADLAGSNNGLPDEIRAGLLSLAQFSMRHGHAVLARKAAIDVLIDINMSIMKGLRGEVTS